MAVNVGTIDRITRIIIAALLIAAAAIGPLSAGGWPQIAAFAVGAILLGTSAIKFCPLYRIFGLRSCPAP